MKRIFPLISLLLFASLLLGACGTSADNESAIATAVALTMQAQVPPTAEIFPSATPADLGPAPSQTPAATPTTSNAGVSYANCMSASLISENPPDKTIYHPGEKFLKTWHIKNTSNCTWTPSYKVVFWDGNIMGGAYNYNFPQTLPPGQSANVSLWLVAPDTAGTYKSEWKFQTPDGQNFGVGSYQNPVWYEIIVVAANVTPTYGITAVNYDFVRDPASGCATNTWYTFTANVSFSGPMKEVILQFKHSDGFNASKIKLEVKEAGTQSFTDTWKFHFIDAQGPKWVQLIQLFPEYVEFDKFDFTWTCN